MCFKKNYVNYVNYVFKKTICLQPPLAQRAPSPKSNYFTVRLKAIRACHAER